MVDWLSYFTHYAGSDKSFFDVVVDVFYDTILPLNGLLVCLFVRYRWKQGFDLEVEKGDPYYKNSLSEKYIDFSLGTFIPIILLVIFINTVALKFFGTALFG
jgi:NSS family neurotransmitter:Na+ symporter